MAKAEFTIKLAEEFGQFLTDLADLVERMEAATKLVSSKNLEEAEKEFDEDEESFEDEAPKKAAKKKTASLDENEETTIQDLHDADEEESFDEPPKKKAKKLTLDDVNDACKARASKTGGKEGRNEVLSILKKKFKTTSVSDLEPDQYAAAIAAMKG